MAKKSDRNIVPGALYAKRKAQVNLKDLDTPLGPDLALPPVGNRLVELSAQAAREPNRIWDRAGGKGISGQTRSHLEHIYGSDRLGLEAAINRAANPQATEQIRGMNQRAAQRPADPTYGYDGNRGALAQRIRDEGGYVPGTPSSPGVIGTPGSDRLYPNPKDTGSYFQFSRADFPSDRYPNSPLPSVPGPNRLPELSAQASREPNRIWEQNSRETPIALPAENRLPEPSAPALDSHGLELRADGTEYPTALPASEGARPLGFPPSPSATLESPDSDVLFSEQRRQAVLNAPVERAQRFFNVQRDPQEMPRPNWKPRLDPQMPRPPPSPSATLESPDSDVLFSEQRRQAVLNAPVERARRFFNDPNTPLDPNAPQEMPRPDYKPRTHPEYTLKYGLDRFLRGPNARPAPVLDGSTFNAHDFIKTREESSLIPGLITDPIMNELLATMLA